MSPFRINTKPTPKPPRYVGGPVCEEHRNQFPCPQCEWGGWRAVWYWLQNAI